MKLRRALGILVATAIVSGLPQIVSPPPAEAATGTTPSGRLTYVRAGSLYTAAKDGTGEQQLLAGVADPTGTPMAGEIRNPRWSPDGSYIIFDRYVPSSHPLAEEGALSVEIRMVNPDGTGETPISGLLPCPLMYGQYPDCQGSSNRGFSPRGDAIIARDNGFISMYDPAWLSLFATDPHALPDDYGYECSDANTTWQLLGVDARGRFVGRRDLVMQSGEDVPELEFRKETYERPDHCWDSSNISPDHKSYNPYRRYTRFASTDRQLDMHADYFVAHVSRDGTQLVHTRADEVPEDQVLMLDVVPLFGGATRRLEAPLQTPETEFRMSADGNGVVVAGTCDHVSGVCPLQDDTGLWNVPLDGSAPWKMVANWDSLATIDGRALFDVQCVPATCVPPPKCPPGMVRVGFFCMRDADGDRIADHLDNCPNNANAGQADSDGDGIGDACQILPEDEDQDGVPDPRDNCWGDPNPDQTDTDGDGTGDACDDVPDDPTVPQPCVNRTTSVGYRAELLYSFPLAYKMYVEWCSNGTRVAVKDATIEGSVPPIPGGTATAISEAVIKLFAIDRKYEGSGTTVMSRDTDGSITVSTTGTFNGCASLIPGGFGKHIGKVASKLGLGKFLNKAGSNIGRWAAKISAKVAPDGYEDSFSTLIQTLSGATGAGGVCLPLWKPVLKLRLMKDGTVQDVSDVAVTGLGYETLGGIGYDPEALSGSTAGLSPAPMLASSTEAQAASTGFGDGVHSVPSQVAAGTYYAANAAKTCAWWRLSSLEDSIDSVIANDASAHPAIVTVGETDVAFESEGCGSWVSLQDAALTSSPTAEAADGMYRVGPDLAPGLWRAPGSANCLWARLSAFGGTEEEMIQVGGSEWAQSVELRASDAGFAAWGCGTWTYEGTAPPTVPDPPTAVTAVGRDASAEVSWTAPGHDGGSAITGYLVTATPDLETCSTEGATTSCTVGGLENGTSYTFRVRAINAIGTGTSSALSNAVIPADATPPGVPIGLIADGGFDTATRTSPKPRANLQWANPLDPDLAAIDVRRHDGSSWVETRVPTLTTSHELTSLTQGKTYTFGARAMDAAGNRSGWTTDVVKLDGSAITSAVSRTRVIYGSAVTVSGKLTRAGTTTGIGTRSVELQYRMQNTDGTYGSWRRVTTLTTTSTGTYSYAHKTPRNSHYRAVFIGWGTDLGSVSTVRAVNVAPKVTATLSDSSIRLGTTVTLSGSVAPNRAGKTIYLQRYVSGVWKTVTSKALSSYSTYKFSIKPSSKGKFLYRTRILAARPYVEGRSSTRTLTVG